MLDPVLSPSMELARFHMVIVFTKPRHFVRSHASSFTSPFFFIAFSTCFFHICFGLPLPLLPLTSNFKAFTITFSSSFLKTWPNHQILLALAILSKDSFMPNMSIIGCKNIHKKVWKKIQSWYCLYVWYCQLCQFIKLQFSRRRTSWRDQPDARQLSPGIQTLGTSWCLGHPDDKSSKLLRSVFFLFLLFAFPRYATATLLTINIRLLWRKYNIFR